MTRSQLPDHLTRILLDPDGSGGDVFGVIVQRTTGVAFATQCAGLCTDERHAEGFFVPISGLRFDPERGRIDVALLRSVFHRGDVCRYDFDPSHHVAALRAAVSEIPFWYEDPSGDTRRVRLELDESRLDGAVEAWVPVVTPLGPGILVWPNCD